METTYLTFNFRNWVTVVLMAAVGFMLLSLGAQLWHKHQANS